MAEDSHVDFDTDVAHTIILYNIYTIHSCVVSVVGKYASREKVTMSNLVESDEVCVTVVECNAASTDVIMASYTFPH